MQNLSTISLKCDSKVDLMLLHNQIEREVLLKVKELCESESTEKINNIDTYTEIFNKIDQKILSEREFKALFVKVSGDVVNQCLFLTKL